MSPQIARIQRIIELVEFGQLARNAFEELAVFSAVMVLLADIKAEADEEAVRQIEEIKVVVAEFFKVSPNVDDDPPRPEASLIRDKLDNLKFAV